MKTLDEIKNEVAKESGNGKWEFLNDSLPDMYSQMNDEELHKWIEQNL